jgi:hypothetical protein
MLIIARCRAKIANGAEKTNFGYAGNGIAMVTLIESTVSVTIRHSDSAPTARVAATVWVSRDEATGAERPSKPAPPGDRIMAEILHCAGESPATFQVIATGVTGNIAAVLRLKMAK